MTCPQCGYVMYYGQTSCPRCIGMAQNAPPVHPGPPLQMQKPREPASPLFVAFLVCCLFLGFFMAMKLQDMRRDWRRKQLQSLSAPFSFGPQNQSGQMQFSPSNPAQQQSQEAMTQMQGMNRQNLAHAQELQQQNMARAQELHQQNLDRLQSMRANRPGMMGSSPMESGQAGLGGPGHFGPGPGFGGR